MLNGVASVKFDSVDVTKVTVGMMLSDEIVFGCAEYLRIASTELA
jgi:uncharacterized protein YaiE (UPF0345 family)